MNAHVEPWLDAYLDGELSAAQRRLVAAHLQGCAACREALAERRAVSAWLQAWPPASGRLPAAEQARRVRLQIETAGLLSAPAARRGRLVASRTARLHWGWLALPLALALSGLFWVTTAALAPLLAVLPGGETALAELLPAFSLIAAPGPAEAALSLDLRALVLPPAAMLGYPAILAALALLYLAWLSSLLVRQRATH